MAVTGIHAVMALKSGEREVLGVVMPRRASAAGFLPEGIVVVDANGRFTE
jgi:hypothetical protein